MSYLRIKAKTAGKFTAGLAFVNSGSVAGITIGWPNGNQMSDAVTLQFVVEVAKADLVRLYHLIKYHADYDLLEPAVVVDPRTLAELPDEEGHTAIELMAVTGGFVR